MSNFLKTLGIETSNLGGFDGQWLGSGPVLDVITPIDGSKIGSVKQITDAEYDRIVSRAHEAFLKWRMVPAPKRGEVVRQLGVRLREVKKELGALVTLEMGKIAAEGEGEVQEMIDICDFACGLSRQLYGLSMHSERPQHRMFEQWHPLGVVGIISAFNFPVAVWSLELPRPRPCAATASLWKPASKTPLTRDRRVRSSRPQVCKAERRRPGHLLADDRQGFSTDWREACCTTSAMPLISATGSLRRWAIASAKSSAGGSGAPFLELGGNNAIIVTPSARASSLDDCARSCSACGRHGRAAAARARGRIIVHATRCVMNSSSRLVKRVQDDPDRQPAQGRDVLMGPLVTHEGVHRSCRTPSSRDERGRRRDSVRAGEPLRRRRLSRRTLRQAVHRGRQATNSRSCRKRRSRRSCTSSGTATRSRRRSRRWTRSARRSSCTTTCRRGCRRPSSHAVRAGGGEFPRPHRQRLRHREREYRHERGRDRRRVRWREGDRWRTRVRLGRVEGVHAGGRRTRSTGARSCRWRKGSSSGIDGPGATGRPAGLPGLPGPAGLGPLQLQQHHDDGQARCRLAGIRRGWPGCSLAATRSARCRAAR